MPFTAQAQNPSYSPQQYGMPQQQPARMPPPMQKPYPRPAPSPQTDINQQVYPNAPILPPVHEAKSPITVKQQPYKMDNVIIDDTPFGSGTFNREPVEVEEEKQELSQDAFEAGQELFQTFNKPVESQPIEISPEIPNQDGVSDIPLYEFSEQSDQPFIENNPYEPVANIQPQLPNFDDSVGEVSMIFNRMANLPPNPQQIDSKQAEDSTITNFEANQATFNQPEILIPSQENIELQPQEDFFNRQAQPSQIQFDNLSSQPMEISFVTEEKGFESNFAAQQEIPNIMPIEEQHQEMRTIGNYPQEESMKSEFADTVPGQEMIDQIAQKVAEKISSDLIKEIAWEVVPEIIEKILRDKIIQGK
jgi:hypothetical protein